MPKLRTEIGVERMSVKPILFNTEMVRAILDDRKTVTRRLPSNRIEDKWMNYEEWVNAVAPPGSTSLTEKEFYEQYPPYRPGDILYVRETWCLRYDGEKYFYKADKNTSREEKRLIDYDNVPWRPSIHMPKEAARIFLKVTNVRVERLLEIDDEQAKAEGANWKNGKNVGWKEKMRRTAVERFAEIWNSAIKKSDIDRYGWGENPWVWVIEFERCDNPELLEVDHEK